MRPSMFSSAAAVTVSALVAGAALTATPVAAAPRPGSAGPALKLIAAQNEITLQSYSGQVFVDPGIYLAAMRAQLQFDVKRASYTQPITITQVTGSGVRRLPAWTLDGYNGLKQFFWLKIRNSAGKQVYAKQLTFCPDGYQPQRVTADSPQSDPFPQSCAPMDPFPLAEVWGIPRNWAQDTTGGGYGPGEVSLKLPLGNYTVSESVSAPYQKLFGMSASDSTVTVKVAVVKSTPPVKPRAPAPLRPEPNVPLMNNPPSSVLPDLVALPSWGITLGQTKAKPGHPSVATVNFGATVWINGNGPLDVQGFRDNGAPVMKAYQYFWRGNKVIGRAPAGTMGFDSEHGHDHWHFQQFARYQLLNASKKLVLRSRKVGFCIAPTDGVNMLLPHAVWIPSFTGFNGACGSPTALWVREMLPLAWGDTYFQTVAGQSFDVTSLPNGTYYIQITANPEGVLHETTTKDNTSLRKIILGGTTGHRTIQVPAWNGLDPGGR